MGFTEPPAEPMEPISSNIWKEDKIQLREYQQKIYERAKRENLMVVIPTGLGKTYIAAMGCNMLLSCLLNFVVNNQSCHFESIMSFRTKWKDSATSPLISLEIILFSSIKY